MLSHRKHDLAISWWIFLLLLCKAKPWSDKWYGENSYLNCWEESFWQNQAKGLNSDSTNGKEAVQLAMQRVRLHLVLYCCWKWRSHHLVFVLVNPHFFFLIKWGQSQWWDAEAFPCPQKNWREQDRAIWFWHKGQTYTAYAVSYALRIVQVTARNALL